MVHLGRALPALFVSWLVSCADGPEPLGPAELQLASVCSDHMVLQRATSAAILGHATPGRTVTVTPSWPGAVAAKGKADAKGRFVVRVATGAAGGPFEVAVACGDRSVVLHDVLVGEVWLGSGQSNMEMPVGEGMGFAGVVNWREEAANGADPALRLFTVKRAALGEPGADAAGAWEPATPDSVAKFSAAGYFFSRKLRKELGVPVGFIASDWGGTPVEAWMSPAPLVAQGDFAKALEDVARSRREVGQIAERRAAWWRDLDARRKSEGAAAEAKPIDLPHVWTRHGLANFDGVGWYERTITLDATLAGRDLELALGPIDDMDSVWWDDAQVGATHDEGHWHEPRTYAIPAQLATEGQHRVTVLALDTAGEGGLGGLAEHYVLRIPRAKSGMPLATGWTFRRGPAIADLPKLPSANAIGAWTPAALYHGMIAPLVPFTVRGWLWYQGESNRGRDAQYRQLFAGLIRDWRTQWGAELPFYFVQIAPYGYGNEKGETAALRDAQASVLNLPRTGMVVTLDIGDARDIHPKEKRVVGERLALHALRNEYGKSAVVAVAPSCAKVTREGAALVLHFTGGDGTLVGSSARGFEVAGADGSWHAATAQVAGATVTVASPEVAIPTEVRYAWSAVPDADLRSGGGLPVAPFRAALR